MRVLLYMLTAWIALSIPVALVMGRVCGLYKTSPESLEPVDAIQADDRIAVRA